MNWYSDGWDPLVMQQVNNPLSLLSTQGLGLPGLPVRSLYAFIKWCLDQLAAFLWCVSLMWCVYGGFSVQGTPGPIGLPGEIGPPGPKVENKIPQTNSYLMCFILNAFLSPYDLGCIGFTWSSRTPRTSWQTRKCQYSFYGIFWSHYSNIVLSQPQVQRSSLALPSLSASDSINNELHLFLAKYYEEHAYMIARTRCS